MTSTVLLQGGAEFGPGYELMDSSMLHASEGRPRRVLVAPFAGRPGRDRETAGANASRWYAGLGATDVTVAPTEDETFARALAGADLLVLPGGSPRRLLDALAPHREALRAAQVRGLSVSGSSAGAMVLCRWTVLPDADGQVVPALGLVAVDLVLPHFCGDVQWLSKAWAVMPPAALVLGIPERAGVLVPPDGSWAAAGEVDVTVLTAHV